MSEGRCAGPFTASAHVLIHLNLPSSGCLSKTMCVIDALLE
ncbi:uncharacterized protein METZ01_LOCUS72360 [marine metagenome]|uniref:Uncharacterized protein n=1 Tax=marine metagenome TaxID=408172 RepID=A0A381TU04_9ZZZZ